MSLDDDFTEFVSADHDEDFTEFVSAEEIFPPFVHTEKYAAVIEDWVPLATARTEEELFSRGIEELIKATAQRDTPKHSSTNHLFGAASQEGRALNSPGEYDWVSAVAMPGLAKPSAEVDGVRPSGHEAELPRVISNDRDEDWVDDDWVGAEDHKPDLFDPFAEIDSASGHEDAQPQVLRNSGDDYWVDAEDHKPDLLDNFAENDGVRPSEHEAAQVSSNTGDDDWVDAEDDKPDLPDNSPKIDGVLPSEHEDAQVLSNTGDDDWVAAEDHKPDIFDPFAEIDNSSAWPTKDAVTQIAVEHNSSQFEWPLAQTRAQPQVLTSVENEKWVQDSHKSSLFFAEKFEAWPRDDAKHSIESCEEGDHKSDLIDPFAEAEAYSRPSSFIGLVPNSPLDKAFESPDGSPNALDQSEDSGEWSDFKEVSPEPTVKLPSMESLRPDNLSTLVNEVQLLYGEEVSARFQQAFSAAYSETPVATLHTAKRAKRVISRVHHQQEAFKKQSELMIAKLSDEMHKAKLIFESVKTDHFIDDVSYTTYCRGLREVCKVARRLHSSVQTVNAMLDLGVLQKDLCELPSLGVKEEELRDQELCGLCLSATEEALVTMHHSSCHLTCANFWLNRVSTEAPRLRS
jgi:hypothetical protein